MRTLIALILITTATAGLHAHVTVSPQESASGRSERYTVRVPTEGQVATTSVEVEVPVDVTVTGVLVGGAYSYEARREGNRIVAIIWKLDIKPAEVAEFVFFARNPSQPGQVAWKARQRFADGTSADWVGGEGDRRPAAVTRIVSGR